jgi:hypothetical protein
MARPTVASNVSNQNASLWGNFVYFADNDLLAFAWLFHGGLRVPSYYHATQSVEKYLKALAISGVDPNGISVGSKTTRWVYTHDLCELAERCKDKYPYYSETSVLERLRRFTEFDKVARYPLVQQNHGNGFTSADVPVLLGLIEHLRTDIPITLDDYPLGILVRGFHQGRPEARANDNMRINLAPSLVALRVLFPNLGKIVRW